MRATWNVGHGGGEQTWPASPPRAGVTNRRLVAAFVLINAAILMSGKGALLAAVYPASALAVGALLFRSDPAAYVVFSWWLWFVTPGVRRVVDLQAGWNPLSPVALTPLLVSALTLADAFRHAPKLRRRAYLPFALVAASVVLGFAVALIRADFPTMSGVVYAVANWLVPAASGVYVAMHWAEYPRFRQGVTRTFAAGIGVLGAYGIFQFVRPPSWDAAWMLNSGMVSIGAPVPFQVRVFSLMNSPGVLAQVLVAGLLLLPAEARRAVRIPATVLGSIGLLLTLVRASWIALLVGLAVYLVQTPPRAWRRTALGVVGGALLLSILAVALPSSLTEHATGIIARRVESLTNLSTDVSYDARSASLRAYVDRILADPLGSGLGATGVGTRLGGSSAAAITDVDNGVLEVIFNLGWAGAALFFGGLTLLVTRIMRATVGASDAATRAGRAVIASMLVEALGGNVFAGVTGAMLWTFVGLSTAGHLWSAQQRAVGATGLGI